MAIGLTHKRIVQQVHYVNHYFFSHGVEEQFWAIGRIGRNRLNDVGNVVEVYYMGEVIEEWRMEEQVRGWVVRMSARIRTLQELLQSTLEFTFDDPECRPDYDPDVESLTVGGS